MDWQSILASITASSLITGAIIYFFKKSFDKTLDLKFKTLEEQNKANIQELKRRESLLYDEQFSNLKRLLSLVYEARNTIKDFLVFTNLKIYSQQNRLSENTTRSLNELTELLHAQRAILPKDVFGISHEIKTSINLITANLERLKRKGGDDSETLENIQSQFKKIDSFYLQLTEIIHTFIGNKI